MKMLDRNILAGRSPLSAAAACIYFISHLLDFGKSAKEISAVAGVSDSTIRNSYKLLYEVKDTLIDETWIARGGKASRLPSN
jgi:transcription initiation factor TFIIB